MKSIRLHLALIGLIFAIASCSAEAPSTTQLVAVDHYFPVKIGPSVAQLQLALSDAERSKGLMFRDPLAQDHGMCFIFETPAARGFWMQNTRIPLDIGYFDASGRLLEVHPLYPYDEMPVRSRSHAVLIAIEMSQGWYAENEIKPGARINMAAIRQAIQQRGQPLERFQIQMPEVPSSAQ
ncbi:MAG: uncharacterized membrane protein (UPF0127 family) [Lentimonas sp.]|jgi:uncharacterized membrane protein (UPF0127 family)